jgi:DNA-binding NarL/FixJ family response regulator
MLAAIRHVLGGNVYVSEKMSARILDTLSGNRTRGGDSPVQKLSDREFEVFRLLGEGLTTKEIAERLHLSGKTVAVHRGHIKEKLAVKSATELMHHAVRWTQSGGAGV